MGRWFFTAVCLRLAFRCCKETALYLALNKYNTYSVTRLTVATQQTFLQVSQSGYTNVIDGHASLQSWRVKIILSSELPSDLVLFVENNSMSEVYKWLKNLPGDLKLEKCSKEFESRGFHTLESLKYLRPGDIDSSRHRRNCCWQKNASWKAKSRRLSTRKAREHR